MYIYSNSKVLSLSVIFKIITRANFNLFEVHVIKAHAIICPPKKKKKFLKMSITHGISIPLHFTYSLSFNQFKSKCDHMLIHYSNHLILYICLSIKNTRKPISRLEMCVRSRQFQNTSPKNFWKNFFYIYINVWL